MKRNFAREVEQLEQRLLMAATGELRSIDGTGNNLLHPQWGSTGEALIRLVAAQYADGIAAPAGADRPSPREISNTIAAHPEDEEMISGNSLSAFAYLWGQFIDHDLDLTTSSSANGTLNIPVPGGDESFDPMGSGDEVIPLSRSNYLAGTGVDSPRQQVSDITAYLDGSMIYGSDATRAAALREFAGGRLLTSDGDLLPFNTAGLANANDAHIFADNQLFLAGDVRANENAELTSLHTLFVREHNRRAAQIAAKNPAWSDEQIYQQARRLVIGEIQSITYNEFLPALLGSNALPRYRGYDPKVNAGISNEFSTAAFRLGHSMLADDVEFISNDGEDVQDEMALAEVFFNPSVVEGAGIDPIMKYLASSNAEEIDNMVVDGVRNFLFGPPGAGGLDLASLNIQRGREHGLADYNSTREALGLQRVTSFHQISSNPAVAAKLEQLYGSVDDVDLWVGGLAEDHVRGSNLGQTFQRIVVDQFTRTRAGDRFWFERDLSRGELSMVRSTSLGDIIKANTDLTNLQDNVFKFDVTVAGTIYNDRDRNLRQNFRGEGGVAGITLEMVDDEDGSVIDTAVTGRGGQYRFTHVQIGDYTIRPVLAKGMTLTTAEELAIDITRGGGINRQNFGVRGGRTFTSRPRHFDSTASDVSVEQDVLLA
jgi:hypothetical protein